MVFLSKNLDILAVHNLSLIHIWGTLRFGTEGFDRPWAMRQAHRSPAYTTRWEEVPKTR